MADDTEGLRIVGEIQHVRLHPGDVIVITVAEHLTVESAGMIRRHVERVFPDHASLVLDAGMRLEVARREKADG